jgi:magnesium transporter
MAAPVPTVPVHDPQVPRTVHWARDGQLRLDPPPRELAGLLAGDGLLWVDIDSRERSQHALLEQLFAIHPLAIDDTRNPESRVKLEEYDGYLFIVMRGVAFREATEDPYDLETNTLFAFLGPSWLVTVHDGPNAAVERVAAQVRRSPELMRRGVERVLHAVLDDTIDAFFPILQQIDEFVDSLEERVFVDFDHGALRDLFQVKRLVLSLRRHLQPSREVLNVLSNRPSRLLTPATQLYFRDIYDHVLRINDSIDTYRELLSSTMDSYLTQVSNRLGSVTKALSVVATLSIPFVVVSGMWGMNFAAIPLADAPHGFWLMLVAQAAAGVGLLAFLRWRRLL